MGDDNVVVDGNYLNYIPIIRDINSEIHIFQSEEIKQVNTTSGILLITKFMFSMNSKTCAIESIRTIIPSENGFSNSNVKIEIKKTELSLDIAQRFKDHIFVRHQKQNSLMRIAESGQEKTSLSFPVPFHDVFADVRESVMNLELMVREEHEIDNSISLASSELQMLKFDIERTGKRLIKALQNRDQLENEVKQSSWLVSQTALQLTQNLQDPNITPQKADGKNDIAFSLSLIPLALALFGYIMKKK